jgi:hypothetical protein
MPLDPKVRDDIHEEGIYHEHTQVPFSAAFISIDPYRISLLYKGIPITGRLFFDWAVDGTSQFSRTMQPNHFDLG